MKKLWRGKKANCHLHWKAGNNMVNTFLSKLIGIRKYLLKIKSIGMRVRLWLSKAVSFIRKSREGCSKAFTVFETVIVLAVMGTLLAVAIPIYTNVLNKAKIITAITDIAEVSRDLEDYLEDNGEVPETLDDIRPNFQDPWGRDYIYLAILGRSGGEVSSEWRKDRFQVPLNTDFDLFSMGKDGDWSKPLTAAASFDDIIRASNGDYIGPASKY
jgi:general secretion pathway protein G